MHIPQVMGGVHLLDMPLFRISEMAGRIALKFGVLLDALWLGVSQKLMEGYTCTCAHEHPSFHILRTAGHIALKIG